MAYVKLEIKGLDTGLHSFGITSRAMRAAEAFLSCQMDNFILTSHKLASFELEREDLHKYRTVVAEGIAKDCRIYIHSGVKTAAGSTLGSCDIRLRVEEETGYICLQFGQSCRISFDDDEAAQLQLALKAIQETLEEILQQRRSDKEQGPSESE